MYLKNAFQRVVFTLIIVLAGLRVQQQSLNSSVQVSMATVAGQVFAITCTCWLRIVSGEHLC